MSWEKITRIGYGLLKLMPDQLYALSPIEFIEMYYAYQYAEARKMDSERQNTAWLISYIVSTSTGKKTAPDKVYNTIFDEHGDLIEDKQSNVKVITVEEHKRLSDELLAQFNISQ